MASIWETLSEIDVNKHVEKKGNLSYLSWAWAWGTLMEHYPDAVYQFDPPVRYDDGSCEIWVNVTIGETTRRMWLPVMDHKNNAILNPDARKISDTRMRCLVKALAMFGLGHYIYAGEDLPSNAPSYTEDQKHAFDQFLTGSALGLYLFRLRVGDEIYTDLYNSFETNKVAEKKLAQEQEKRGFDTFEQIKAKLADEDDLGALELIEDENKTVIALLKSQLTGPQRSAIESILKAGESNG